MAKKVFENQLDSSIVGLHKNEKANLKSQLEEASRKMKGNMAASLGTGSSESSSRDSDRKVSFFKQLWNFLLSLIFSIPYKKNATISIVRVQEIKKLLNSLGVNFYDFKSNAVTSEFALYVLDIYHGARIVYEIFNNPKSDHIKDLFFLAFFENLLSDKTKQIHLELSKEQIETLFYNEGIKDKREALKEKQQAFAESMKQADAKNIQTALLPLEQLSQLYTEFDFQGFFDLFGSFHNSQVEINRTLIDPESVLPYLKKLGAVIRLITEEKISESTEKAIQFANVEIQSKNSQSKGDFLPIPLLNKSLSFCRKLLKFNILDSMIQYISMDEKELTFFTTSKKVFYNKYLNMIVTESIKDFNSMEDEKAKEFLMKDIVNFFGVHTENDLITPGIYNQKTKKYLENYEIKTMDFIKPLSMLLTFLKKHYEGIIRGILNSIVVKGSFVKKLEGELFSTLYYKFDEVVSQLNSFLQEEYVASDLSKKPILEIILSEKELTPVERKNVKEKLTRNDKIINEMIVQITEDFYKVTEYLVKMAEDFKKTYPEVLSNIRNLRTESGQNLQTALEQALEIIEKFFSIMRNFVVIKSEVNNSFKQMEKMGK